MRNLVKENNVKRWWDGWAHDLVPLLGHGDYSGGGYNPTEVLAGGGSSLLLLYSDGQLLLLLQPDLVMSSLLRLLFSARFLLQTSHHCLIKEVIETPLLCHLSPAEFRSNILTQMTLQCYFEEYLMAMFVRKNNKTGRINLKPQEHVLNILFIRLHLYSQGTTTFLRCHEGLNDEFGFHGIDVNTLWYFL